jgi:Lon protease-like protein
MLVRAHGQQRFRITSSDQLKHGLWVADVERMADDLAVAIPDDLKGTAEALGRLIQSLQQKAVDPQQVPLQGPWQLEDCGWVANRWCELLPLPVTLKQRLMELDNPLVRLELVSDVLARTGIAG